MERKQNTQEGGGSLPWPNASGRHTCEAWVRGLLSWTQCATPKARPLFEQKRDPSSHILGVWLRRAQAAERTCSKPRLSCAESTVPAFRVKPANSSEITQDSTCGTSLSLAQYTGGQHRLRLEKRGRVRSREETPDAICCHLPQRGPTLFSASSPWQEEPDLQSHVGWWEWRCLLNTASAS